MSDGKRFQLLEPLVVETRELPRIAVPAGFVTDFASVPWLFRRLFPAIGRYTAAAVVHDYLYQGGQMSKRESDKAFDILMQRYGCGAVTRWCLIAGLKVGGWVAWRKHRAAESEVFRALKKKLAAARRDDGASAADVDWDPTSPEASSGEGER